MCYRDTVDIDLRGIGVACLSGENGAGKSALLDGITWSLWGKARVNSDRELIALNATEMEVTFGFMLDQQEFRVTRRRTRGGAGPLHLELQVSDGERWRTLSGSTSRETQQAITNLLRMDYDTFINSAFILQGRADEFTTKTPAQRKQVLAEILNLRDYDLLEEMARQEHRQRERRRALLDAEIDAVDGKLAGLSQHQADVERLSQELITLNDRVQLVNERLLLAQSRVQNLEFGVHQREILLQEVAELEDQIARLQAECQSLETQIKEHEAIVAREPEISAALKELQSLRGRSDEMTRLLAERQVIADQAQQIQRAIDMAVQSVQAEKAALERQIKDRALLAGDRPKLHEQIEQIERDVSSLPELQVKTRQLQAEQLTMETRRGELQAENKRLHEDMNDLKARMTQIEAADALCPVCRRPLGPGERERIRDSYQQDGTVLGDKYRENRQELQQLQHSLQEITTTIARTDEQRTQLETLHRRASGLQERLASSERAEQEIQQLTEQLQQITASLDAGIPAADLRVQLIEVEQKLATLPYNRDEHVAIQQRMKTLRGIEDDVRKLDTATAALESERGRLGMLNSTLQSRTVEHQRKGELAAELSAQVEELVAVRLERDQRQEELDRLARQRSELQEQFGAAQQRLNDCLLLQDRREELVESRRELVEESVIFDELTIAFGKRGIQAMIIENIVPELQEEANKILDMMPGNTMQLEFRTQRQALSGDSTIETLDIVIGDEAGRRPYELYSGGEAFRVNFAIRVALSTLLARRAGTRLQTLVIDEGFGSQDSRGRDGLIEAIRAIERDFQMILVITHISDLKDVFPNKIEVLKTPNGSVVSVN